jgi:tRNA(Ile)-lysidine synthase
MKAVSDSLLFRVAEYWRKAALAPSGSRILIALSGGPDSVALLHILTQLREELGISLAVCHINHKLRGAESEADAEFCASLAASLSAPEPQSSQRSLGISFVCEAVDVPRLRQRGESTEMAARRLRWQVLGLAKEELACNLIATGHTADDQAETILLNLARGTGPLGLGGMAVKSGDIIRPLLGFRKAELLEFLVGKNLPFRTDSTNSEVIFRRNAIRAVLPSLSEAFGTDLVQELCSQAAHWREYGEMIDCEAQNCLTSPDFIGSERLGKTPELVATRALYLMAQNRGIPIERKHTVSALEMWRSGKTGEVWLPQGALLVVSAAGVTLLERQPAPQIPLPLESGETTWGGWRLSCCETLAPSLESIRSEGKAVGWVNPRKIRGQLRVRRWQVGERVRPIGFAGTKLVSDMFGEKGILRPLRSSYPVVADELGAIWSPGLFLAERVRVEEQKTVLRITAKPLA